VSVTWGSMKPRPRTDIELLNLLGRVPPADVGARRGECDPGERGGVGRAVVGDDAVTLVT
jgi:hypothetical protein